jgi:hypothetical protein
VRLKTRTEGKNEPTTLSTPQAHRPARIRGRSQDQEESMVAPLHLTHYSPSPSSLSLLPPSNDPFSIKPGGTRGDFLMTHSPSNQVVQEGTF